MNSYFASSHIYTGHVYMICYVSAATHYGGVALAGTNQDVAATSP